MTYGPYSMVLQVLALLIQKTMPFSWGNKNRQEKTISWNNLSSVFGITFDDFKWLRCEKLNQARGALYFIFGTF